MVATKKFTQNYFYDAPNDLQLWEKLMGLNDERGGDAAQRGTAAQPFRFFDNREKFLQFVSTCDEKWQVAQRVGADLE